MTVKRNIEGREAIRNLVEQGLSSKEIASVLNMGERQVQRLRADMGISLQQPHYVFTDEQKRQIELWLEDEVPLAEIARTLGVSVKALQARYKGRGAGPEGNLLSCRKLMAELGLGVKWEDSRM